MRSAEEWLELEKIPKIRILKTPPSESYFLPEKECRLLLSELNGLHYDIVLTALKTGLRIGELKGLRWRDIQWDRRTLTVNHSWCNTAKGLVAPKGNKERRVPLTADVYSLLLRRQQIEGFVFGKEQSRWLGVEKINSEIKMASHLAMKGVSLQVIQRLLGHASIQVTMRYAHLSETSLRDSMDLLEPSY
jgi:integrase